MSPNKDLRVVTLQAFRCPSDSVELPLFNVQNGSGSTITQVAFGNYVGKVVYEIVATPITYLIVGWLKEAEKEDFYDRDTNFNPFVLNG